MNLVDLSKKEEIKQQFKNFFEQMKIPFEEKETKITVKGEAYDVQISHIPSISVKIEKGKYLDIIEFEDFFKVMYIDTNTNKGSIEKDINKGQFESENPVITYFDDKLIIYF